MPTIFYAPGGTKMFFHEDTPEKCRELVTLALDAHPNAYNKVMEGKIDEAAMLLTEDGRPTSAFWLLKYCTQGVYA